MQCTEQEKNSWITELSKALSEIENYNLHGMTIYIFGSYAKTTTGRDIDLLIIYDKQKVDLPKALHIRKNIAQQITKVTRKQTHICLLSIDEKEWQTFIKEENAMILINQAN